ncbi:MAG: hypothetical protein ACTSYX_09505, partial [Candidatus Thorarchaeota archaeon]
MSSVRFNPPWKGLPITIGKTQPEHETGYSWAIVDPRTGEIMMKGRVKDSPEYLGYISVEDAKHSARNFAKQRARWIGPHTVEISVYEL